MTVHRNFLHVSPVPDWPLSWWIYVGKIRMCFHIFSFFDIEMAQTAEIVPRGRQCPLYHPKSISRGRWWYGDARNQDISSHGMKQVLPEYSGFITKHVKSFMSLTSSIFAYVILFDDLEQLITRFDELLRCTLCNIVHVSFCHNIIIHAYCFELAWIIVSISLELFNFANEYS